MMGDALMAGTYNGTYPFFTKESNLGEAKILGAQNP
jgi:hypothetical protein